ncbi:MAG: hypothetical protein MUF48_18810, partial [Pirellulaceae bacterium]|nr:hypothetical protein [Pirellulaceae bacterium]
MFQHWYRLRVGLMTLVIVGAAATTFPPGVEAGKPAPPPTPPVTYTLRLMPLPAGTSLCAAGMNNHGQVVASGYLWKTATNEIINLASTILNDDSLQIVPSAEFTAALAGNPGGTWPLGMELRFEFATINDFGQDVSPPLAGFGQIAANFSFMTAAGVGTEHAFRYTPTHSDGQGHSIPAQFIDLGVPSGWGSSFARGINKWGDIVGCAEYGPYGSVAVLWLQDAWDPAKVALDLEFSAALIDGRAYAINDFGQVTGYMLVSGATHAFRYTPMDPHPLKDLGVLYTPNPGSDGRDINASGDVTGTSYVTRPKDDYYKRDGTPHAFIYTDASGMVDLGALTSSGTSSASHINDLGQVVGGARLYPGAVPAYFLYT